MFPVASRLRTILAGIFGRRQHPAQPKDTSKAVRSQGYHSPRWYKKHPDVPRPVRQSENTTKKPPGQRASTGTVLAILPFLISYVFGLGDIVPLWVTALVCLGAACVGSWFLWRWELAQHWKGPTKLFSMLVYFVFLVPALIGQYENAYDLHLRFKDDTRFTWWMKLRINWNFLKATNYLKELRIPTTRPADIPPVDIAYGGAGNVSLHLGDPSYRGDINIPESNLDEAIGHTHSYISYEVAQILSRDLSIKNISQPREAELLIEFNDLTDYFNSALWKKPGPNLVQDKNSWPAKLWDARQNLKKKYRDGGRYVDQMVAYTLMSLGDNPEEAGDSDPDVFFCRHLKIGDDRVDHNAEKWNIIVSELGDKYWNACRGTF